MLVCNYPSNADAIVSLTYQALVELLWNIVTWIGFRRLVHNLIGYYPAYSDTTFFFDNDNVEGYVALTIDDGLSRGGKQTSLVPEVLDILRAHDAKVTFFVCTDYLTGDDMNDHIADVIKDGHELGNHMKEDLCGYYSNLSQDQFDVELKAANKILDSIDGGNNNNGRKMRWFRAPQGVMTEPMKAVLAQNNSVRSALCDCYCGDCAFSETDVRHVAPLMLRQVQSGGSIAILHMPERGFREMGLQSIKEFLEGCKAKNLKCITLSEMDRLCSKKSK